jgi:uncharacterized protein YhdP
MPLLRHRGVRAGILAAAAVIAVTGTLVVAYELALARVPEHRAALERLVRSQTGLDVRFNELGLRWGWYGPEAVFRRVELGEPGRSNVLLRAPQLVIGFNAWETIRTGQLAAGRITLVAPDIDLERLAHVDRPAAAPGATPAASAAAIANAERANRARLLRLWRGGRIEIEGGTLRLPDPGGSANPLIVQVRRAVMRRTDQEWNGYGLIFLPERLGRAARITVQLQGDPTSPATLTGGLRFEGMRLSFAGWRDVLRTRPTLARSLPASGAGDVTLQLTLKDGRVEKANGDVKANEVTFGTPVWVSSLHAAISPPHGVLKLDYLSGDWRYVRRATGGGQVQIEQLVLSRDAKGSPLPRLAVDFTDGHVHGSVASAPLESAAAVAQWLSPSLVPAGVELKGTAKDVDFDWNSTRPEGFRLAASARTEDASVAASSGSFALSGLRSRLTTTESRMHIELDAPAASLALETASEALADIKLASVLEIVRSNEGWRLTTDHLSADYDGGRLVLSGALSGTNGSEAPVIEAHGSLSYPDIGTLHTVLANGVASALGPVASRLTAGRIEESRFELAGPVDELFAESRPVRGSASLGMPVRAADSFKGSLTLKNARVAAGDAWPEMRAVDAELNWVGSRVYASIDRARAGAFEVEGLQAEWDASGTRGSRITGRAHARVEKALAWLQEHPELREHVPHLADIDARGRAMFDFELTTPAERATAPRGTPPKTHSHLAAMLEGVRFRIAPDLPPIESLRGSLAFDDGQLQRSTLTGAWQGKALTLKVAGAGERAPGAISVHAQGVVDTQKLIALSQFRDLVDVSGDAAWNGEFLYTPPTEGEEAQWRGYADSNLVGVESNLPAPLGKLASAILPLHLQLSGEGDTAEVHATLAEGVRSAFSLRMRKEGTWEIERGTFDSGSGSHRLEASLQADAFGGGTNLRVQSESVGLLTGILVTSGSEITLRNVQWSKDAIDGEGSVRCAERLSTCTAQFAINTDSAARALAAMGYRPDVAATSGTLTGQITWEPRPSGTWIDTASGKVRMRLDDGIARTAVTTSGEPFPLLTVPALLTAMSRPGQEPMASGELRFRTLDADFELRDGEAYTSNLHFDGEVEILVRGRTGLLARDYDHEAWVLRGEERIPSSLRRLAATPRVAAAWMALRDLVGADSADRSRVVLHLHGSWSEPVVSVD